MPGDRTRGSRKASKLSRSCSRCGPIGSMLIALWRTSDLDFAGHTSTQTPQPVQSSGATWMVSVGGRDDRGSGTPWTGTPRARPSDAAGSYTFIRIAACGQTRAHLPQSMQISGSQIGISARERALLVPGGPGRERAVDGQRADRQEVALAGEQPRGDTLYEVGGGVRHESGARRSRAGGSGRDGDGLRVRRARRRPRRGSRSTIGPPRLPVGLSRTCSLMRAIAVVAWQHAR